LQAEFIVPSPPEAVVYDDETITIIEDGVSDYVIVRGAEASGPEITAAEKLQGFLLQISGAEPAYLRSWERSVQILYDVEGINRHTIAQLGERFKAAVADPQ